MQTARSRLCFNDIVGTPAARAREIARNMPACPCTAQARRRAWTTTAFALSTGLLSALVLRALIRSSGESLL